EENVAIEMENNVLTISGEKSEERTEGDEERRYHLWERRYGQFPRSFTLPRTVKGEDIRAGFEKGVLRIRMPKVAEAKTRKIAIEKACPTPPSRLAGPGREPSPRVPGPAPGARGGWHRGDSAYHPCRSTSAGARETRWS
ncbi:MAG: Hsp20/alpha crystallin family protein, partial [Gemmatimonadetes bacterium]|nr:Hsp20/alpha crystallin family protein [Gemmatimonadota bacterium]